MRMVRLGSLVLLVFLGLAVAVTAQDSPAPAPQSALNSSDAPAAVPTTPAANPGAAPASAASPSAPAATQSVESAPPAATTLNDVLDRVVQREHYFMAQMRHMHPLIETYLQDLKNDSEGNGVPVKDSYFLGRLDMTDGPEDTSFVGQPGFGHRMLTKLTGVYSLHFLPMGFAQMVVLDEDFQKKILQVHVCTPRVSGRSPLPGHRCPAAGRR